MRRPIPNVIKRPRRGGHEVCMFIDILIEKELRRPCTLPACTPIPAFPSAPTTVGIPTSAGREWRGWRRQVAYSRPQRPPGIIPRVMRPQRSRDRRGWRTRDGGRIRGEAIRMSPPPTRRYPDARPKSYAGACPIESRRYWFGLNPDVISVRDGYIINIIILSPAIDTRDVNARFKRG